MTVACLIVSCFLAQKLTNVCTFYFTLNRNIPCFLKQYLVFGLQITVYSIVYDLLVLASFKITFDIMSNAAKEVLYLQVF